MVRTFGKGVLAFVILTVTYFLVSGLAYLVLYYFRQLYSLPTWLQYPEVIGVAAAATFAGMAAGWLLLERVFKDYPERPVMICFGLVMLALVGIIVVGQVNYPADDLLNGFVAPLSRGIFALGFTVFALRNG